MKRRHWIGLVASLLIGTGLSGSWLVLKELRKQRESADSEPAVRKNARSHDVLLSIYDRTFTAGWSDWGWGPHEVAGTGPIKVQFLGFGGIILRHEPLTQHFGGLLFRYKPPRDWPEFLTVSLRSSQATDTALPSVSVDADDVQVLHDGWREAWVDMLSLNPQGVSFDRIVISARRSVASDWVLLDQIALTKSDAPAVEEMKPTLNVPLAVLCSLPSHPISPLIYGSALGDWNSGQSAQRIGGNPTSRANWDLQAWNSANDWFFENNQGSNYGQLIAEGMAHGAQTAVTVPIMGWVAKDLTSVGFPPTKFPGQRKVDPNRSAGDGYTADNEPIAPGPPTQTSMAAPPELIGNWIRRLRDADRARPSRGVLMYILDNEPSLWSSTHRDVHPEPLTYDELLDKTVRYATAIRAADPDTMIAGPAEWGWLGYFYSARDVVAGKFLRPDRRAHGDIPLLPWYLQKVAQHEKATGVRLLDVLDVHFYPAADGVFGANARTDADGAALRLRATRSLWDPKYRDESWIDDNINLIPRLKDWVAANHPGLRISIGEWNFGAENDVSGALATAESLGRFGQQGVYSAFFWGGPKADSATFWAFRAFRNFDGRGGRFLDESLATREDARVSLFASRDAHGHLVAVALNRDATSRATASIRLEACGALKTERGFVYTRGATGFADLPIDVVDSASVQVTLPPYSLAVFDLTLDGP